jgi:hypothetical protein
MMLPVLVWLPNAIFVVFTVVLVFMILQWVVVPPRSRAEAIFEAHKVVVVGGFSLAAVGIIELVVVASKAPQVFMTQIVVGAIVLLVDALFGLGLFAAALVQYERVRETQTCDTSRLLQVAFGVFLFVVAASVAVIFKSFEAQLSSTTLVNVAYV